ncbi:endonuclease [Helicobacter pylori]|uniref:BsaWI family type II restriction enzyme n=1 Tax=Helicobacter pylori TaxID=210 RepID=UPI000D374C72|nr:BsaWI family type II restriction enzyme [Helicobacter pylori]MCQ2692108.1 endonuclease [Helicobacter pylori]PUD42048.1 endonuclease [Helicobacter pylori]WRG90040.1 endonuclease [Helicobacter pylori]
MSLADIILERFKDFMREQPEPYKFLQVFYAQEKERFLNSKISDYIKQNKSKEEASILARQGFVSAVGRALEKIIELLLKDFCIKNNVKMTNDKTLRAKRINGELDKVKRALLVHFGGYSVLPDIILYQTNKDNVKILAILSVKNSFRERFTETPYWKLKLLQSPVTSHIKVFMITPDNDEEISFKNKPKKARIVMEHELDGLYLAKSHFDQSPKIKGIENLLEDLKRLL